MLLAIHRSGNGENQLYRTIIKGFPVNALTGQASDDEEILDLFTAGMGESDAISQTRAHQSFTFNKSPEKSLRIRQQCRGMRTNFQQCRVPPFRLNQQTAL